MLGGRADTEGCNRDVLETVTRLYWKRTHRLAPRWKPHWTAATAPWWRGFAAARTASLDDVRNVKRDEEEEGGNSERNDPGLGLVTRLISRVRTNHRI